MDGRTHTVASVTAGVTLGLGALAGRELAPEHIAFICGGCLLGVFLTPDHDVDAGNITHLYWRKLIGTDLLWRVFWNPYALAFRHRSLESHAPVISTVIRWLYLISPIIVSRQLSLPSIVAQALSLFLVCGIIYLLPYIGYTTLLFIFIGNMISDILHWIVDL